MVHEHLNRLLVRYGGENRNEKTGMELGNFKMYEMVVVNVTATLRVVFFSHACKAGPAKR